jgi:hypothetical protein
LTLKHHRTSKKGNLQIRLNFSALRYTETTSDKTLESVVIILAIFKGVPNPHDEIKGSISTPKVRNYQRSSYSTSKVWQLPCSSIVFD